MKKNSVAMVTGASRGIGRAIALALAKEGYSLALCCQNQITELEKTAKECKEHGASCFYQLCDLSSAAETTTFINEAVHKLGEIQLLINNAGISYVGLLTDMSIEEWNNIINVNLSSLFLTCRQAIPSMVRNQKGQIINISSVWGNQGASMEVAYSASKGGVNAFTKALAKELAPSKITVNAIACGLVNTQMNQNLSQEELQILKEEIPTGKIIEPEEIGLLCASLTKQSPNLTGQIITLDGGWCC